MLVRLNVGEIRKRKQSTTNLENSFQEFQNGSKVVNKNEIKNLNQNSHARFPEGES